jgi:hypothetical protein
MAARKPSCTLSKPSEVTGGASAVERLRPGWAGTTLTGRYNEKRAAADEGRLWGIKRFKNDYGNSRAPAAASMLASLKRYLI